MKRLKVEIDFMKCGYSDFDQCILSAIFKKQTIFYHENHCYVIEDSSVCYKDTNYPPVYKVSLVELNKAKYAEIT